jgi:hypothetical protein
LSYFVIHIFEDSVIELNKISNKEKSNCIYLIQLKIKRVIIYFKEENFFYISNIIIDLIMEKINYKVIILLIIGAISIIFTLMFLNPVLSNWIGIFNAAIILAVIIDSILIGSAWSFHIKYTNKEKNS